MLKGKKKQIRIQLMLALALLFVTVMPATHAGLARPVAQRIEAGPPDDLDQTPTPESAPLPLRPEPTMRGKSELRITAIGDVNMNRNRIPVFPQGSDVFGSMVPFNSFVERLAPLVDGDINFANIETVVTDRNDFNPPDAGKAFCFRSHPNAIKELLRIRFNLFGMANNHAFDFGSTGVEETLKNFQALKASHYIAYTGIGMNYQQASAPAILEVNGISVGLVAIGIGSAATASSAGVAYLGQYRPALARLRDADVDVRLLSLHDGKEGTLTPIDRQLRVAREAIRDFKVNVVLGHHPHRIQGVELYQNGVIFYSLGNGLMRGAMDIGGKKVGGLTADFGLMARINVSFDRPTAKVTLQRLEAVPIYDMQQQPHALPISEAQHRVRTLNELSELSRLQSDWNSSCPMPTAHQSVVLMPKEYYGYLDLGSTN